MRHWSCSSSRLCAAVAAVPPACQPASLAMRGGLAGTQGGHGAARSSLPSSQPLPCCYCRCPWSASAQHARTRGQRMDEGRLPYTLAQPAPVHPSLGVSSARAWRRSTLSASLLPVLEPASAAAVGRRVRLRRSATSRLLRCLSRHSASVTTARFALRDRISHPSPERLTARITHCGRAGFERHTEQSTPRTSRTSERSAQAYTDRHIAHRRTPHTRTQRSAQRHTAGGNSDTTGQHTTRRGSERQRTDEMGHAAHGHALAWHCQRGVTAAAGLYVLGWDRGTGLTRQRRTVG